MSTMTGIEQWPWVPGEEAVGEAFVNHCLSVVDQDNVPATVRRRMERSSDPLEVRKLAIERAGLSDKVDEVRQVLSSEIEPYVGEHEALPAALLHGAYERAGSVGTADVQQQARIVWGIVEPLLYEARIGRTSLGPIVTTPGLEELRERMQADGVRYDSPAFEAKLGDAFSATPPGAVVRQAQAPVAGQWSCDLDDLIECESDFSPHRTRSAGVGLYYRELARFGTFEAIDNLGDKFRAGEVYLGDTGKILYRYLIDRGNRDRDEEFLKCAEAAFADGMIEGWIGEVLVAALKLDEAEAHEKASRMMIFDENTRQLECAANEAGCGFLSYAAPEMCAELSTALRICGSDDVQCAAGGPSCGGSVLTTIERFRGPAPAPGRAWASREQVEMSTSVGRPVIELLAVDKAERGEEWRNKIIALAYRYRGLSERQPGQRQLRQQPRVTDGGERNGTGIISLRVRA